MGVFRPVSGTGCLFARERGEVYQFIPGVFRKTPQADLVRVSFFHEHNNPKTRISVSGKNGVKVLITMKKKGITLDH